MDSLYYSVHLKLEVIEERCSICGVYDSYYQCDSCNKKFCIDDWDKVHSSNSHLKQRIIFPINEESRQLLIEFFEKLKSETFNFYKQKIIESSLKNIEIKENTHKSANIYFNWWIRYISVINSVTKRLLYFPLDYYLINPPIKTKIFISHFNFSSYKDDFWIKIVDFILLNYIASGFVPIYGLHDAQDCRHPNLRIAITGWLVEYLSSLNYKSALELLNNTQEFPYLNIVYSKSGVEFNVMKMFIISLINKDFNISLDYWDLWEKATKAVNKEEHYYWPAEIFYSSFEIIFRALNNKKYLLKCYKYLENLYKRYKWYLKLDLLYTRIAQFYCLEGNDLKRRKYLIKAFHILKRNKEGMAHDEQTVIHIYHALIRLMQYYRRNQVKQNILFKKCNYYFTQYKNTYGLLAKSLLFFGAICYFSRKLKDALQYLKKAENEIKKSRSFKNSMQEDLESIYYYEGLILSKSGYNELAVRELNNVKIKLDKRAFKYNPHSFDLILKLGKIYFKRMWYDVSLTYFEEAKDYMLNVPSFFSQMRLWRVDDYIGKIYMIKGEIKKSLEIFERLYMEITNRKLLPLWSDSAFAEIVCIIATSHTSLGNIDKGKYYAKMCLEYLNSYEYQKNPNLDFTLLVDELCFKQNEPGLCELICLNAISRGQSKGINYKLAIQLKLLRAYTMQRKNEESDKVMEYIKSNKIYLKKDRVLSLNKYLIFGWNFYQRKDYIKAEKSFRKAKEIIEKCLKSYTEEKMTVYYFLAMIYRELGRLDQSENYFDKALSIVLKFNNSIQETLFIYYEFAKLYILKNDWKKCKHYISEYIKFRKENCHNNDTYANDVGLLIYACKRDNDNTFGRKHWYKLKKFIQRISPHYKTVKVNLGDETIAIIDLNNYDQ